MNSNTDELNETTIDNELIVTFMGAKKSIYGRYIFDGGFMYEAKELIYNSSWDWLMPVVEKIELLSNVPMNVHFVINRNHIPFWRICFYSDIISSNYIEDGFIGFSTIKIEATWKAVIEFIKWYNLQSKS